MVPTPLSPLFLSIPSHISLTLTLSCARDCCSIFFYPLPPSPFPFTSPPLSTTPFPNPSYPASRLDLKSPLHVWNNLLAETRRIAKEHCGQAEVYTNEMTARFDIMAKDVHVLSRRVCCVPVNVASGCVHFVSRNSLQHDCLSCIASVCT